MINILAINYKRILRHSVFWLIFLLLYSVFNATDRHSIHIENFYLNSIDYLHSLPSLLIVNYIIVYFLIPHLLIKKRYYILVIIFSSILVLLADITEIYTRSHYFLPTFQPELTDSYLSYAYSYSYIIINFYNKLSVIIIFFSIKFFKDYIIGYYENVKLKQVNDQNKIQLLKKQLQPNLLFNALKHIEYLNEKERNEEAAESVALISDILRYSLYHKNELVTCNEEVSILCKFLKLQKINNPTYAIEIIILNDLDTYKINHLLLFYTLNKVTQIINNTNRKKELILKISRINTRLGIEIVTSHNEKLLSILRKEIKTLLGSFASRKDYQLLPNIKQDTIALEFNLYH